VSKSFKGNRCGICDAKLSRLTRKNDIISVCFLCRANGPPDEHRCNSNALSGKRCKRWAKLGMDWCAHHTPKED